MSTAWLFPGQGSHYVGMGQAWAARSPLARAALDEASDVLGADLLSLMAEGPIDQLEETSRQQPALLVASVAALRAVADDLAPPAFVAGHSVGEYAALVAAGALRFADALSLVGARSALMRDAGTTHPGGMAAILGLEDAIVEAACAAIEGVMVGNYNAPGQVVISGTVDGVEAACAALTQAGAKRIVPIRITVAAHSHLMAEAASAFGALVDAVPVADADVPVMANVSSRPITASAEVRAEMRDQLTHAVRWTAGIEAMLVAGVTTFYEIGPGTVLGGLVKRTARGFPDAAITVHALGEPPTA
ncbi:MAG: ACP S-malonyltransferase [Ardenticatenales bacterium]|jgi:[acyl-carrier-protein] S-malonyltransferase|nr:ACP S-malonyltransferase [Ardenticatenales bacterium]